MRYCVLLASCLVIICSSAFGQKRSTTTESFTGVYEGKHNSIDPDEVRVLDLGNDQLWVELDAFGGAPNPDGLGGGLYSGTAFGVATVHNDSAIVIPADTAFQDCRIVLRFLPGHRLRVTLRPGKDIDCGFGSVRPNGMYRRISKRKPKLDYFDEYRKPASK